MAHDEPASGRYRHFKGGEYEVLGLVRHSETLEPLVLYREVNSDEVWARPSEMFGETVERDGVHMKRFERIE